jgi:acetamidase/formamidase
VATLSSGPVVVGAEHLQVSFDAAVPAAVEIDPGTVVAFETSDAIFRRLATGESLAHKELQQANAVTGPVGVRRGPATRCGSRCSTWRSLPPGS